MIKRFTMTVCLGILSAACANIDVTEKSEKEQALDTQKDVSTHQDLEPAERPAQLFTAANVAEYATAKKNRGELCPDVCRRSKQAGCLMGKQECLEHCNKLDDTIVCPRENAAHIRCQNQLPLSALTCVGAGFVVASEGFCEQERAAMMTCISIALKK